MGRTCLVIASLLVAEIVVAADKSPGDQIITDAITAMEAKRPSLPDSDKAKIDKAIQSLRDVLGDQPTDAPPRFDPETIRKKFAAAKVTYYPKTGVLKLEYNFTGGRSELADFEIGDKRILLARKSLGIEAGDEIKHKVKFKTLAIESAIAGKTLLGVSIGTTAGTQVSASGLGGTLEAGGKSVMKGFSTGGPVPVILDISPEKTSAKYGTQVMVIPLKNESLHQVVFRGGSDGCAFGELTIMGIPDPEWLKDYVGK